MPAITAEATPLGPVTPGDGVVRERARQALVVSILLAGILALTGTSVSLRVGAIVFSVTAFVECVMMFRLQPSRPFTGGSIYLLLFALFHGGLLFSTALGQEIEFINARDPQWYQTEHTATAAVLAAWAVVVFTGAYSLAIRRPAVGESGTPRRLPAAAGPLMTMAGVGAWFLVAFSAGIDLLGTTYTTWLEETETTPLPYVYLLMGLVMGAAGASRSTWARRLALAVFVAFTLPAFFIGLRGEVILPAAAHLVAAARRTSLPLRWWMLAVPVVALSAGSLVRSTRTVEGGLTSGRADLNPLSGLTELGYTIRPLSLVSERLAAGEDRTGWETYLSPFKRLIGENIFGVQTLSVLDNDAVFRTFVTDRVGPIGGSPAAEAYRSFGLLGILVVLGTIGIFLAWLERRPTTTANDALVGMAAFPLFLWVRNDFTPIPVAMLAVFLIWLVVYAPGRGASHSPQEYPRTWSVPA